MKSRNDKINAAHADANISEAAWVEQQRIKRALGPSQWHALLSYLAAECEAINKNTPKKLVLETIKDYDVTLKNRDSGAVISLQYEDDVPCVWIKSTEGNTSYVSFALDDGATSIKFLDQKLKMAMFADELGDQLIQQVLGS
jgi:hypothetical protein